MTYFARTSNTKERADILAELLSRSADLDMLLTQRVNGVM